MIVARAREHTHTHTHTTAHTHSNDAKLPRFRVASAEVGVHKAPYAFQLMDYADAGAPFIRYTPR